MVERYPFHGYRSMVGWENRNPHISAVVVVHERLYSTDWREEIVRDQPSTDNTFEAAAEATVRAMREVKAAVERGEEPEGAYRWVTVYEVNGDDAVPVPAHWFDGERDVHYGYTGDGYGRLSPEAST